MKSSFLREKFLDFFKKRGHTVVPSDSLVPASDPTLLFTGAGMNQFKDYFLGLKHDMKRAASCQKCFRTGDVEEVGRTASHLTFFEMLGNFSFGDYFKPEAIRFALDFLTAELNISPDRIWVSVYEKDEEAYRLWTDTFRFPPEKVKRFGEKENFWPSQAPTKGPNGPCGPCSEIYYDYERCLLGKTCPDPDRCAPGCPCGRFVEVWNLVFTQCERQPDGSLKDLPSKSIDTGMGLERLTALMQGKMSVFETDLFEPIIEGIIHLLRREAPQALAPGQRGPVYAIADHVRALTFLIGDGVVPSNDGRGYVVRMLLRRAARHGMGLGLKEPFLYRLVPAVIAVIEGGYPELAKRRESIAQVILTEEERFLENLRIKLPLLEEEIKKHPQGFPAQPAARFYDTHGLSFEEIIEVCQELKIHPPSRQEFDEALDRVQASSRRTSGFSQTIFTKDDLRSLISGLKQTTLFIGYTALAGRCKVAALIREGRWVTQVDGSGPIGIVLDRSPFYGEAGGQVGDQGSLEGSQGKVKVLDTQWIDSTLFHQAEMMEGKVQVGDEVNALVDQGRRHLVASNHTATHLLHSALRRVLGSHVAQAGSLVAPDRLRFDFSHAMALSSIQKKSVETLVNEWIETAFPVATMEMSIEEAQKSGALALFGEKYASKVRVVSIGDVSRELCGGTHLTTSSEVGLFRLVEEGSVAAGVRRISALAGQGALSHLQSESQTLHELSGLLKVPPEAVPQAFQQMTKHLKFLEDELKRLKMKGVELEARKLTGTKVGGTAFFAQQLSYAVDHAALRVLSDSIRRMDPEAVIFLCDTQGNALAAASDQAQKVGISANEILRLVTAAAGGSGGGSGHLAQGRVKEPSKFPEISKKIRTYLEEHSQ